MSSAKDIRNKIGGVRNTQKITKAMEMVAASKMRKAQERMQKSRPYADKIRQVIAHIAQSNSEYQHPLMRQREVRHIAIIVVSSDRGLCGGLNTSLFKQVIDFMHTQEKAGLKISLALIGSKAQQFFKRIGGQVMSEVSHLGEAPSVSQLIGGVKTVLDEFQAEKLMRFFLPRMYLKIE